MHTKSKPYTSHSTEKGKHRDYYCCFHWSPVASLGVAETAPGMSEAKPLLRARCRAQTGATDAGP